MALEKIDSKRPRERDKGHSVGSLKESKKTASRRLMMDIRPTIKFSNRLPFREFETEVWRLYFGFVKGLLTAITSVFYFFVLLAFFLAQHAAFAAARFAAWVVDWNPEKPRVFGFRAADGD